jgi:hypothetical protein
MTSSGVRGRTYLLAGIAIGGFAACLCLIFIGLAVSLLLPARSEQTLDAPPRVDSHADLTIGPDGCSVSRTEPRGSTPVRALTWVVSDLNGSILLERAAGGEYAYRYFRPGQYRIHLKAWFAGQYYPISNEVTVECR